MHMFVKCEVSISNVLLILVINVAKEKKIVFQIKNSYDIVQIICVHLYYIDAHVCKA